jgi:uncharacterized small protein (DUF1192 family)
MTDLQLAQSWIKRATELQDEVKALREEIDRLKKELAVKDAK